MGIIQRQGLKSAIVRVVGMAIGVITTIFLIPAILSVEDIGLIDTMRKMITMGVPLLVMGGPQAIRKYFDPMRSQNESYTLIYSYLYVFIFTATIFTLAYFGFKDQIFSIYEDKSPQIKAYSLVIYMGLMGLAVQNFCMAISSVHRRTVIPDFAQNVMNRGILAILLILVFLNSIDVKNIPRVYKRQILNSGAELMTFATGLLVITLVNGIEILLSIMPNGELFVETRLVLYILGIATLTDHLLGLQQMLINASSKYVLGLINFLAIVILVIILNFLLIPIYGIYGAAITTAIGLVLRAGFNALIMYRSTSLHAFSQKSLLTFGIALLCIAGSFILQENVDWQYRSLAQSILMPVLFLTTCIIASCVPQQVNQWIQQLLKRM